MSLEDWRGARVGVGKERLAGAVVDVSVKVAVLEISVDDVGDVVSLEEVGVEVLSVVEVAVVDVSVDEDPVVDGSVILGLISDADTVASAVVVEKEVSDTDELGDACGPTLSHIRS